MNNTYKEKFDKKFPEAKMLRESELRRSSWKFFSGTPIGKATTIIYLIIAIGSLFAYWKFFKVNIFLSIPLAIITYFSITYIFDIILMKILGIENALRKLNDGEIEAAGKQLEETLKEKGKSLDDFLK